MTFSHYKAPDDMSAGLGSLVILAGVLGMVTNIAGAQEYDSSRDRSSSRGADSSVLHNFEKSVQPAAEDKGRDESHSGRPYRREHDDHGDGVGGDLEEGFVQGMVNMSMNLIAAGGASSMQRIQPGADSLLYRDNGEPLIPFARYDFAYQHVSSGISAHVSRFEGGYGPMGLYLEDYTFNESAPTAALDIKRQMFLYRMSVSQAEVDIGFGQSVITGTQRTVIKAVSLRGRFMLNDNISIDLMPVWGDGMDDYELALHYGMQYGSLKIGYRSLNSPSATLSGPFAGLAFYY